MKHKQRGFWQFALPAIAGLAGAFLGKKGGEETNESNQQINNAQMAFNAKEAEKDRVFQENQRTTQYQTAVGDMGKAGLNPMLAFQQGGAKPTSGAQASAGSMLPMQNATQAGINGATAAANIANVQSQTEVNKQTAQKIKAEVPNTIAGTGQIRQQTTNLKKGLTKIEAEIKNINMDTLEKEERVTLIRAQQQITNVQKDLAKGNITFVEAQTKLKEVETQLKRLGVSGARNTRDFEDWQSSGSGNVMRILQTIRSIIK